MTTAEQNLQLVQQIYAAFGRGDLAAILERCAEDITWGIVSESAEAVPWHAPIKGRANVPRFFQALADNVEFTRFEPHSFAASADHVYCSLSCDLRIKKNGRTARIDDEMHRFTIANGRITEWRGAEDTAKVVALMT